MEAFDNDTTVEEIYISNAGLVLLAPYLPRFFSRLDSLEDGIFKDLESAQRGVYLLQFMCTGQDGMPEEHLLIFNKILCGLPLTADLPAQFQIQEEERALVDSMLNAVLQNWEMMKNSTVENLRGSFLLREGRLTVEADAWQLQVEPKAYDITLDYLPWSISTVRLPWMENSVLVDWRNRG